jgi:hypothetical protein
MAETIIRRPSWLWDSRAPFYNFVREHKRINRQFGSIVVSTEAACSYLRLTENETRGVRQTLRVDKGTGRTTRAWMMFRRGSSHPQEHREANRSPELFLNAVAEADGFVQQAAIVTYAAMFETYILCWTLNYLLAHLESGASLDRAGVSLADTFSRRPRHLNAPDALQAFPLIWQSLASLPHVFLDRMTGQKVEEPVDNELNARSVVLFWREYRNNVVHHGSLVTDSFAKRQARTWERLRQSVGGHLVAMRIGDRLQFNDTIVRAALATHYRAAHWLVEPLVNLSSGRRGHTLAPAPPQEGTVVGPDFVPGALLLPGDHGPSLLFAADGAA